jgi:hypothetical protein
VLLARLSLIASVAASLWEELGRGAREEREGFEKGRKGRMAMFLGEGEERGEGGGVAWKKSQEGGACYRASIAAARERVR